MVNSEGGNVEGNCVAISGWIVSSTLNLVVGSRIHILGLLCSENPTDERYKIMFLSSRQFCQLITEARMNWP